MRKIEPMFENIKSDILRYCDYTKKKPTLINRCRIALGCMGCQATVIYRFGRWINIVFASRTLTCIRYFFLAIHYCLYRLIVKMYGIDIDRRAIIGKGLFIAHFAGIKIGPCKMGEFCSIYQHVKIYSTNIIKGGEFPCIGSRVWIGPHARITGNIAVGDNCTVSAGTIVTEDVSPSNLVVGVPARVVSTLYDNGFLLKLD